MQTPQSLQPGSTHAQRVSYSATKSLAVPPECAASQRFVVARFQFKQTTVGAFMNNLCKEVLPMCSASMIYVGG